MTDDRQGGFESLLGGPRNAMIVLIGVILIAGVGIGAIAFGVFGRNRTASPSTGQAAAPSAAQPPNASPQHEPACSDPPGIEATSWEMTRDGLAIGADLSARCADGNVLTGSAATVTVSMGTHDIASGVFDLSAEPIVISPGGRDSRTFVFPAGMY